MPEAYYTPTDADLQAYDQGLLPEERIEDLTHWLEDHPEGEERLRRLTESGRDYAVEALRRASTIDDELEQLTPVTSRIIDQVLGQHANGGAAAAVPESIRDYRLLTKLGAGGMAAVYRARHNRLQRDVAIKLLPARLAGDSEFRARFQREMAIIGQLDHPHLIRAYDAGVEGDYLFIVMELLDGQNLETMVREYGPLAVADACEAARQAALGLGHAHHGGVIHRDVKPSNVFLTRSGVVKLIDLGLARAVDQRLSSDLVSSVHAVMGTPEFMAPEQWQNPEVGPTADVYSLGCTLFFVVTGRPPFLSRAGASWVDLLEAHLHEPPPDLRAARPDVPAALTDLVAQMLAKSPERRPGSAAQVAEALAAFTGGHALAALFSAPVRAPGEPTVTPLASPARKARLRWLIPCVVLLTAAALALVWHFTSPGTPEPHAQPSPPRSSAPAQASAPSSLLLTGRDHVVLANTVGLIDLNGSFTVEMWVQFDRNVQYFVGDEIWPALSAQPVSRRHGWVLRIEEDRRLDFAVATDPDNWLDKRGPVLALDGRWHHLAVSKGKDVIRVFLDGSPYLTIDAADARFVNSPLNLCLGSSLDLPTRTLHCAFKAFRVSAKQLYFNPFTPPAFLEKTDATRLLLDFRVGKGSTLPDLSDEGHDGAIHGGRWLTVEPRSGE